MIWWSARRQTAWTSVPYASEQQEIQLVEQSHMPSLVLLYDMQITFASTGRKGGADFGMKRCQCCQLVRQAVWRQQLVPCQPDSQRGCRHRGQQICHVSHCIKAPRPPSDKRPMALGAHDSIVLSNPPNVMHALVSNRHEFCT